MDAECKKCGSYYAVRENCEPTPFCDDCAHGEVERLSDLARRMVSPLRDITGPTNIPQTQMRHLLHKIICWYLRRCSGAFHCYHYGDAGRYVVLMTDVQYHVHQKFERVVREILITHGSYGDGGNLDRLTRRKCLELLQPLDSSRGSTVQSTTYDESKKDDEIC